VPVRGDLGVDLIGRHRVQSTPFGTGPGFRQSIGWGRCSADEVLNAHDDDGRFTASVDDEAFVVVHGQIHKLAELGAAMWASIRRVMKSQCINQLMHSS
jgi:hypothetical protein